MKIACALLKIMVISFYLHIIEILFSPLLFRNYNRKAVRNSVKDVLPLFMAFFTLL